jgi:hypothetical protein
MKTTPLLDAYVAQLHRMAMSLPAPRPRAKVIDMGVALMCAPIPKPITSAIEWLGREQEDWSADYRLFAQTRWQAQDMLRPLFHQSLSITEKIPKQVFLGQDDTLLRKSGKKTPGVAYARDPLSPPFQTNLVKGQRFVKTPNCGNTCRRSNATAPASTARRCRPHWRCCKTRKGHCKGLTCS